MIKLSLRILSFHYLFIFIILYRANSVISRDKRCPCSTAAENQQLHILCILDIYHKYPDHHENLETLKVKIFRNETSLKCYAEKCRVVIHIINEITTITTQTRLSCPGNCHPTPSLKLSLDWIVNPNYFNISILCSLTTSMLTRHSLINSNSIHKAQSSNMMERFLEIIYWRRLDECREFCFLSSINPYETNLTNVSSSKIKIINNKSNNQNSNMQILQLSPFTIKSKRRIQGIILWITSFEEMKRFHHNQENILQNRSFHSEDSIIGWFATDIMYPCKNGTTTCQAKAINSKNRQFKYMRFMPNSWIPTSSHEWSCAQRRPLRALAHLLRLFDPTFLLLIDGDSFVNLPLLVEKFLPYISTHMVKYPVVIGEYTDPGKISRNGFLLGGAGYLLGKNILSRLNNFYVRDYSMSFTRRNPRVSHLSLATETRMLAYKYCNTKLRKKDNDEKHKSNSSNSNGVNGSIDELSLPVCISTSSSVVVGNDFVPIGIRLIDLCVKLLSGEFTCHHSDHAVSRCLFFGADVLVKGVVCNALRYPGALGAGMCQEVRGVCDLRYHVTCHRWMASKDGLGAVRIYNDSSMYDEYSSGDERITTSHGIFNNETAFGTA
eukprot:gene4379-8721_t